MTGPRRWQENLSVAQQKRYLGVGRKQGLDEAATIRYYESGGSLAAFRGHAATPERPEQASRNPSRFTEYLSRPRTGGKTMVNVVVRDEGPREIPHLSAAERRLVAQHDNAIRRYMRHGDFKGLRRFEGKSVYGFELEANPDALDDLAAEGRLDFDTIYPDTE